MANLTFGTFVSDDSAATALIPLKLTDFTASRVLLVFKEETYIVLTHVFEAAQFNGTHVHVIFSKFKVIQTFRGAGRLGLNFTDLDLPLYNTTITMPQSLPKPNAI